MNSRGTSLYLRIISLLFITAAIIYSAVELTNFSRTRSNYPAGMTIAGVAVGGVSPQEAVQRVIAVYNSPVQIQYAGATIALDPALTGFTLDIDSMIAAADLVRTGGGFWTGFWDYLWNRQSNPVAIPLISSFSEERLRVYLREEISPRYDTPATPAQPIPGTSLLTPGLPGQAVDLDRAIILIQDALNSPFNRTVSLSSQQTKPGRPSVGDLKTQMEQLIDQSGFSGIAGVYMRDLQTNEEIHFIYQSGKEYSTNPDLAFTASSTIKIPILVTVFSKFGPTVDAETSDLINGMITKSENPPSDALMEKFDSLRGPLFVSDAMETLGLQSTFLAGYFYNGAPQLKSYRTIGNQRSDITTDPDTYSQTTPSEMGLLLIDLYICSTTGGGTLPAVFPGKIDQNACQQMIEYLKKDRIGVLIEAGLPEGTQLAHKHGWVSDPFGVIKNVSDAAIVYSPGGNYVLTVYLYHPVQVLFEPANQLIAELSRVLYTYFNLPIQ